MNQENPSDLTTVGSSAIESVKNSDRQALSLIRCIFALLALFVVANSNQETRSHFNITLAVLTAYLIYSVIYFLGGFKAFQRKQDFICYWIDILSFSYLITALKIHDTVLFSLFLYPIIVASRLVSAREGAIVTFTVVTVYLTTATFVLSEPGIGAADIVNRAVCLFLLGCVITYWAASEEEARHKLKILLSINETWNPRMGVDRTITTNLARLVTLYGADSALLAMSYSGLTEKKVMYRATADGKVAVININKETAAQLTALAPHVAIGYNETAHSFLSRLKGYIEFAETGNAAGSAGAKCCKDLVNILETRAFVSAPYLQRDGVQGRIYVTSNEKVFGQSDVVFLAQVSRILALVCENMSLIDQLTSQAIDYERLQVSRDMHDTTIQPYIGLKLALEALHREASGTELEQRIAEIIHMASITISDLRTYTAQLRERVSMPGENLISAISKQAEIFKRFYGIAVEVKNNMQAPINGQIAAELFQIVCEGLSNILRHTNAKRAFVSVHSTPLLITLAIGNECNGALPNSEQPFSPRSITERAASLDGNVVIQSGQEGHTVVDIRIPNLLSMEQ